MSQSAPESPSESPSAAETETESRYGGRFAWTGSLRTRAARGTLINTAFTVALGLLSLLQAFILARFLSRADYGVWGIVAITLVSFLWLKQAGIGDKFIQQDEDDQEAAFQRALTLDFLVTGACVLLILAALPGLVLLYKLPKIVLPCLVLAAVFLISVVQAPLWVYYRRMEFARQRLLSAVEPVVAFIVSVGLAVAGAGYWAFAGGIAAGSLAGSLVVAARSPYKLRWRYERGAIRDYWSFSAPLVAAGAATFVMAWSAVISAKLAIGVAAVGVVTLADNIASFSEQVDTLVTGALYPAICAVKEQVTLLYESLVKSNRLALMWAVPFGFALTMFASDLVRFGIGEHWRTAVFVLQVYGAAAAVGHIGFNWHAYFRALGNTRPIAAVNLLAAGTFVVVGVPLVVFVGIKGFAIGIAVQTLASLALRSYYLQRIFPAFDFIKHASRAFLPTVPAVAVVLIIRAVEPRGRTLAMALAELAVYAAVAVIATWYLESNLLREAVGQLFDRRPAAVVS